MRGVAWGLRSLLRQPLRTALSLAGIAVAAAMLLDMVMLSGGIDKSFSDLLLGRGFQMRLTPKGTLPFDTEATVAGASAIVAALRRDPAVAAAGAVLGTSLYGRTGDSTVTLFGYGIEPEAQSLYQLTAGRDLVPGDTAGIVLSAPAARLLRAGVGDTVTLVGRLDPQVVTAAVGRRLVVRGMVRWLYDYRGQPSVGTALPVMQRLARRSAADRASLILVKARVDDEVPALAEALRARFPQIEVNSVADLVAHFRERLVYFRQLAFILGSMSLIVTVLLVATLLTITVNERLGEIATLRAIGVSRGTVVGQVLAEGSALTVAGATLGMLLGLVTAEYLDAILTSFPGLPAAFSFFVPRADTLGFAALVLLVTGSLAGLYPAWVASRAPIAATLRAEAT
jgi:putative ABC transport system permease protein